MKKIIACLALAVGLLFGPTAPTTPVSAHTGNEAHNICVVIDVGIWGPENNGVALIGWRSIHFYGLHYVQCCYLLPEYGGHTVGYQYLVGWGLDGTLKGDPWCP